MLNNMGLKQSYIYLLKRLRTTPMLNYMGVDTIIRLTLRFSRTTPMLNNMGIKNHRNINKKVILSEKTK